MRLLVLVVTAGCSFSASVGGAPDSTGQADAALDGVALRDIPHLPPEVEGLATAVVSITEPVTIDTSLRTVTPQVPGLVVETVAQDPTGPDLAVIRARILTIESGVIVKVVGARALVIVADQIDMLGTIDVSANGATAGPGASAATASFGSPGVHAGNFHDSGAGGGGFATAGGAGGTSGTSTDCGPIAQGAAAGGVIGDDSITVLAGGGRGGNGSKGGCATGAPGGGGGGAIQLSARGRLRIRGFIDAGGGGGRGGVFCDDDDAGSGAGGGAGGAIYLDASTLDLGETEATLAANGGGGGGGGCGPAPGAGGAGTDGLASLMVARGGTAGGCGEPGGDGAVGNTAVKAGTNQLCDGNAGGGGGAVGRIVLRGAVNGTAITTPTPVRIGS